MAAMSAKTAGESLIRSGATCPVDQSAFSPTIHLSASRTSTERYIKSSGASTVERMRNFWALPAALRVVLAAQVPFSVQNDVLAFPQVYHGTLDMALHMS